MPRRGITDCFGDCALRMIDAFTIDIDLEVIELCPYRARMIYISLCYQPLAPMGH